jgi:hypothetical protein
MKVVKPLPPIAAPVLIRQDHDLHCIINELCLPQAPVSVDELNTILLAGTC